MALAEVAEGDKVVTRSIMRATLPVICPAYPPPVNGCRHGGKIAEEWEDWNALGMLEQLGVVRPPW